MKLILQQTTLNNWCWIIRGDDNKPLCRSSRVFMSKQLAEINFHLLANEIIRIHTALEAEEKKE